MKVTIKATYRWPDGGSTQEETVDTLEVTISKAAVQVRTEVDNFLWLGERAPVYATVYSAAEGELTGAAVSQIFWQDEDTADGTTTPTDPPTNGARLTMAHCLDTDVSPLFVGQVEADENGLAWARGVAELPGDPDPLVYAGSWHLVEVVGVDIDIVGDADDSDEGFVGVNDDDDNWNNVADNGDTGPIGGEDDLLAVVIRRPLLDNAGASQMLLQRSDTKIRVWRNSDRTGEITFQNGDNEFSYDDTPVRLYVEGNTVSANLNDTTRLTLSAQGESDYIDLTVIRVQLAMTGVAEADELAPGSYVPVNADNDNGSAWVANTNDHIPTDYDFDVHPIASEDDLVRVDVSVLPAGVTLPGSFRVVKYERGRDTIAFWDTQTKTNALLQSQTFTQATLPDHFFVEGTRPGAAEREARFALEYRMEKGNASTNDAINATVTPVLEELEIAVDGHPGIGVFQGIHGILSWVGAANHTAALSAGATRINVSGHIRLTLNVHLSNNIPPNSVGADLGGGVTRKWDFGGASAGHWLVDCLQAAQVPFYQLNEQHPLSTPQIERVTATDDPWLPLQAGLSVLPPVDGSTDVDVTYEFYVWAAWEFEDGSTYYLGRTKTPWQVRYNGTITNPAPGGAYAFAAGANNGNAGQAEFMLSNSLPLAYTTPIANLASPEWR